MPLDAMIRYVALAKGGARTISARRALLQDQAKRLHETIALAQACLATVDAKVARLAAEERGLPLPEDCVDVPRREDRAKADQRKAAVMTGAADRTLTLITGANKGIGLAIARGLGARGHYILLGCRDPQRGQQAAATLAAEGVSCEAVALDVTDPGSTTSAIDRVGRRHGRLDVLINNAGIARDRQTANRDLRSVMRETLETNVIGVACMIDAATPLLAKSRTSAHRQHVERPRLACPAE